MEGGWGGGRSASPPDASLTTIADDHDGGLCFEPAQRLPPRCIADDHDGGLCFEPVVVVVVAVAVAGVAVAGGAGAGGGGVGAVRGGRLKE